nr:methionyl-tRNA formyltransferase [Eubacterium sp.]
MKVIFMGTPDFSVPVLKALLDSPDHEVTAVITQPDKARGRSGKLIFTPVKEVAVEAGIPVYTPTRVKDPEFIQELKKVECQVIVVVAFGQILPKEVLEYPEYGCINVHASLLPRWRGAAPIQWSILAGDPTTGVTTMQMDQGLDTGDMLLKAEVALGPEETGESLFDRLAPMGADLLLETLKRAEEGSL